MENVTDRIEGAANSKALMHPALQGMKEPRESRMLLEAFEMFTRASGSLEQAFRQLQERTRRLSRELAVKNRELEASLREKEEVRNYLETILESLPCGVLVLDSEGDVTLCNPVAAQILGDTGRRPAARKAQKSARDARGLKRYLEAVSAKQSAGEEVEVPFPCGGRKRILATSRTPLKKGTRAGALHILRDVTEVKKLEEQSKRRERLSAMGEMAVQLAHEIRNPLGSIELFASLLEEELPRDGEPGSWAENIRIGSRSLNNIVSNMLHFANPPAPKLLEIDVHELIREILRFLDPILRQRDVGIEEKLTATDPMVRGDRELLKQMFLNLILNSLQAMPADGSLMISTRDASGERDGVRITIRDTGLGIPPENLDRIFDPFFTTNHNGTGLGLSVVHQIVDQHAGDIRVESRVGEGTTFSVVLPGARIRSGAA